MICSTLLADLRRRGHCDRSSGAEKVELRFPPQARALIVDAKINDTFGRFVVDTGASSVVVTYEFADRSGLPRNQRQTMTVNTANGPIQTFVSQADSITLGGLTTGRVFVTIQSPNASGFGPGIDGLLGLSYLGNFDFRLGDGLLTLELPRSR